MILLHEVVILTFDALFSLKNTMTLFHSCLKAYSELSLRKKCPYSELIWSASSSIWAEYGEILRISPNSVRMRENADQNNSECGLFSRSVYQTSKSELFYENK